MENQRAYALMQVKAVDDQRRIFRGVATTPSTDRVGDVVNSMGASFKNPLPLLHQHRHDAPIGTVTFDTPTDKGIKFEAEIPVIHEPMTLRERVDTAWAEIKHGLVKAVSIGFRPIKFAFLDDGGIEFQEIEIYELSTVSIPANAQALISGVKSMTPEIVQELRRMDRRIVKSGPVTLIRPPMEQLPKGSVRLTR